MTTLSPRIAALAGADRQVDWLVWQVLGQPEEWFGSAITSIFADRGDTWGCNTADGRRHLSCGVVPRWTSDLSAVVAEVERRGWWFKLDNTYDRPAADVYFGRMRHMTATKSAPTPCLALLSALVEAAEGER